MTAAPSYKSYKINKGNWSELYVFLKILSDRKLQSADHDLAPILDKSFSVQKVLKTDSGIERIYDISGDDQIEINFVNIANQEKASAELDYESITSSVPELLKSIQAGSGYFEIPEMEEILKLLNYGALIAKSTDKGDIKLVIHDYITNLDNEVDFSIKSFLGGQPTLLNAGKTSTNMIFRVSGPSLDIEEINQISSGAKVQKRIKAIYDAGAKLHFKHMLSPQFQKNLRKIDSLMPIFLSEYVRAYYTTKSNKIADLTHEVAKSGIIKNLLDVPFSYEDIKYKIKQLLINSALGMVPQTDWDGFYKADGGYIVVKKSGDMVCFHIYNIADLGEYLYNNTAFDTPSTKPTKFDHAYLFEDNNELYFKLNFQIRITPPKSN
jgi:type II restriction enzyme